MTTKKEESKAVAVVDESLAALPAFLQDSLSELSGMGNSQDAGDSSLPFLAIIQTGSPQLKEEDGKFIPDAKAGFIFNTATRAFWAARFMKSEDGLLAIPCGYSKHWVEWKPNRGGYVETHPFDTDHVLKLGAKKSKVVIEGKERDVISLPNGNILTETAYTYLLVDGMPMVLGAASTALGAMRDWMSYRRSQRVGGKQLPAFAKKYRLQTVLQQKDTNSWYNWKFSDAGFVLDAGEFELARAFAEAIARGEVQIGRPDYFDEESRAGDREELGRQGRGSYPADGGGNDEEIPI